MDTAKPLYRSQVIEELDKIPSEYLPSLLKMLRAFREGVTLPTAEAPRQIRRTPWTNRTIHRQIGPKFSTIQSSAAGKSNRTGANPPRRRGNS